MSGDVTEQRKTSGVAVGCSNENPSPLQELRRLFYLKSIWCDCKSATIRVEDHKDFCPYQKLGRT